MDVKEVAHRSGKDAEHDVGFRPNARSIAPLGRF